MKTFLEISGVTFFVLAITVPFYFHFSDLAEKIKQNETYYYSKQLKFYDNCLAEKKKYECDALWGSAYKLYWRN